MAATIKKNPAGVVLGRKGGKKGGSARVAKLTPGQRSESARRAVQARWAKAKQAGAQRPAPSSRTTEASKKALHLCLRRIKQATDENELRRLTEELQRILFHKQYRNAEN